MLTTEAVCSDILTRASGFAGVTAVGEVPSAEVSGAAMNILNGMLDAWSIDSLYVYNVSIAVYALTSGQQSYNVGLTATAPFNIVRPSRVQNANLVYSTQSPPTRVPLNVLDDDGWMGIAVRGINGTPTAVYYSPSYPLGVLNMWPIPTSGFSVELELWTAIPQFADFSDAFVFPPGYFEAVYMNLGLRMQTPEFGIDQVSPTVRDLANQSRTRIQNLNTIPSPQMRSDAGMGNEQRGGGGYRNLYNPAPIWTR